MEIGTDREIPSLFSHALWRVIQIKEGDSDRLVILNATRFQPSKQVAE